MCRLLVSATALLDCHQQSHAYNHAETYEHKENSVLEKQK